MKKRFQHYRRPNKAEFEQLWADATIVLDANVLLNAYRYSNTTRRKLLQLLRGFRNRLWIPHQAAAEFHRSRLEVMFDRRTTFAALRETIEESRKLLDDKLSSMYRDTATDTKALMADLESAHLGLIKELEAHEKEAIEPTAAAEEDPIWRAVLDLFDGRTGDSYDSVTYQAKCDEGAKRFAEARPPGFADKGKAGQDQYGDFILWQQMLDYARDSKQPILFVTDDRKEDWWLKLHGRTIGPRPELVEEMNSVADVAFYMYQPDQFMTIAAEQSKTPVSPETIREVQSLPSREPRIVAPEDARDPAVPDFTRLFWTVGRSLDNLYGRVADRQRQLHRIDDLVAGNPGPEQLAFLEERRRDLGEDLRNLQHRIDETEQIAGIPSLGNPCSRDGAAEASIPRASRYSQTACCRACSKTAAATGGAGGEAPSSFVEPSSIR